jgi:acyl carrier protein
MSDNAERLRRCFSLVFPAIPENAIPGASVRTVADWDSLANINLLTVIEEEFGIAIATPDLPKLTSFHLLAEYLDAHGEGNTE